jgi:IS4 transposase
MSFAQLSYRESLRDIESCLRAMQNKLYHMGIRSKVSRSTLADANENRDWRIYADFAQVLIHIARDLYADDEFGVELDETVYALDASTIDLCLSLFPWARFRKTKGAVKLHTLLDLRGCIPTFISITDGKVHDVNILDQLIPEPGAFYVMDRGYLDFRRLYILDQCMAFFIIRSKVNTKFRRLYSRTIDKDLGLRCDQTILLSGIKTSKQYPDKLRRVGYFDHTSQRRFSFLTNNFIVPALIVAELYRCRWQVELFFKWIKQHLRIKSFYGTSENAVKTQIWIAVSVYVLVAIVKKRLRLEELSLYTILQILSVTLFEKTSLLEVLTMSQYNTYSTCNDNQLKLFTY